MPLCSSVPGRHNPETPVDQSNNIVDISKVGLKQFWNLRSHMQEASTLATAHYPEILDRIFVSSQLRLDRFAEMLTRAFQGHRRTLILPRRLGLDQEMVRPHYHLQDIHPRPTRCPTNPLLLHRDGRYPKKVRRKARLRIWKNIAKSGPGHQATSQHRAGKRRRDSFRRITHPMDRCRRKWRGWRNDSAERGNFGWEAAQGAGCGSTRPRHSCCYALEQFSEPADRDYSASQQPRYLERPIFIAERASLKRSGCTRRRCFLGPSSISEPPHLQWSCHPQKSTYKHTASVCDRS